MAAPTPLAADELGNRVLAQVHEESLHETLKSLWHEYKPSNRNSRFDVAPIDEVLDIFHASTQNRRKQASAIEITSVASGSGKTQFLYYLTSASVLPPRFGGRNGLAIVLDADQRFDVNRLSQIMLTFLKDCQTTDPDVAPTHEHLLPIVMEALQNVIIFRPSSLNSLIATVKQIPADLKKLSQKHSTSRSLDLVALDSVSAFLWQDRFASSESEGRDQGSTKSSTSGYQGLVAELRNLQDVFRCKFVATNWGLSPDLRQKSVSFRPMLPSQWQSFITLRLVVGRRQLPRLDQRTTLEGALKDVDMRQAAMNEGVFYIWLDYWNSDSWSDSLWDILQASPAYRGLEFHVTGYGVKIPCPSSE